MFDPCGTRHVDGEEIIKRLADYLGINPDKLNDALIHLTLKQEKE